MITFKTSLRAVLMIEELHLFILVNYGGAGEKKRFCLHIKLSVVSKDGKKKGKKREKKFYLYFKEQRICHLR